MYANFKVVLIWEHEWRQDFNVFPAKIWIFIFFFLVVFAIKMLLDNTYGLPNLFEFKSYHFNSFFQAESEFKNSNFGGKYIEIMSSLMFSNKYDFSHTSSDSSDLISQQQLFVCIVNQLPVWSKTKRKKSNTRSHSGLKKNLKYSI